MRDAIRKFWGFAAFMANGMIFLLLGLTQSFLIHDVGRLRDVGGAVGVAILAVLPALLFVLWHGLAMRREVIADARAVAAGILDADPTLAGHPALAAALRRRLDEESAAFLGKG